MREVIEYAAEYSWGGGAALIPITGTITESTVLVGQDCKANLTGPGC